MSDFDNEIRVDRIAPSFPDERAATSDDKVTCDGHVHPAWNIGANPNGGYLLAIAANALRQRLPSHPDPLSITVHYLRPGLPGQPCRVETTLLRSGRNVATLRATLLQGGEARLEVTAAMGSIANAGEASPALSVEPPAIPPPEGCVQRSGEAQRVELPILQRLEIRLDPAEATPGAAGRARVTGWIRFADGRDADPIACLLMADAFPPSVFGVLGAVGWVPTVELTVHLRRRPAPGWLLGRFETRDLVGGRMIEDGLLWDSRGRLVAQSRQLALVRTG